MSSIYVIPDELVEDFEASLRWHIGRSVVPGRKSACKYALANKMDTSIQEYDPQSTLSEWS